MRATDPIAPSPVDAAAGDATAPVSVRGAFVDVGRRFRAESPCQLGRQGGAESEQTAGGRARPAMRPAGGHRNRGSSRHRSSPGLHFQDQPSPRWHPRRIPDLLLGITAANVTRRSRISSLQGREEGADLVVDLGLIADGRRDLFAQQQAVPASKAVNGDTDVPLGRPQPAGDLRLGVGCRVTGQDGEQFFEFVRPARVVILAAETLDDPAQQGQGPGPVEDPLRGQLVGGLACVSALGVEGVDGERTLAAAPLRRVLAIAAGRSGGGRIRCGGTHGSGPASGRPWRSGRARGCRRRIPGSGPVPARACGRGA